MQPLWSRQLPAAPRGLALARERGLLLVWDAEHSLHLFNRAGDPQARVRAPDALAGACCADDGAGFAAVGAGGQVWLLAPDLMPRWERAVPRRGTAVALDPFGRYVAAADGAGGLSLFDHAGRPRWRVENARPLHHVAFVPERPALAGAADFGLVVCCDAAGRVLWRDAPVAHAGSLAVNGDGTGIALACFTDGLCRYALDGPARRRVDAAGPCRLVAASYDGDVVLTADLGRRLVRSRAGGLKSEWEADGGPVALALDALGEDVFVALADGRMLMLRAA